MNNNLKDWLAYNANKYTGVVLLFGSIVLIGVLVVWSLQSHTIQ